MLEFLHAPFSTGLTHSTLKVYVAAIAAYHAPLGGQLLPPGYTFPPRCDEAQARSRVPHWDLAVVLEALCRPPFEPIEDLSDRLLTLKTVFLLAISSLKRVGDLQALSVDPSYLDLASGLAKLFCTLLWGMSLRSLPLHHGLLYFRLFVHLPSESPTRRGFIVCVQCEHWMRTSTELPCGERRTNCWYARGK